MSHTVVRGQPTAAQLYLDKILKEILLAKGIKDNFTERDKLTIAEIIFHCLKKNPKDVCMINGATGEKFTNEYILKRAVVLARTMIAKGLRGKTVMLMMRNHQRTVAMYWAVIFAGVVPFMMDPNTTVYEISSSLKLIEPHYVFCDLELHGSVTEANKLVLEVNTNVVIADEDQYLEEFTDGFTDDYLGFQVAESSPDGTVMLLPTSGSTGMPKAALMSNKGLVAQLVAPWSYHTRIPKPTELAMVLTTIQWMTFTLSAAGCAALQVPLLISPKKSSVEHALEMLEKYRPSWTFFGPAFGKVLIEAARPDQLSSLRTVVLLGAPATPDVIKSFQTKLPKQARLCDGYGTTETQGFIAMPDRDAPVDSNGPVFNFMHYKVINDDGVELGPGNSGEVYIKGECVIKGYYKNDESYKESFVDGWYKTGDWFHLDKTERLSYIERRKFSFKFMGSQVSPEEIEAVIGTVPGVQESIVCATDNGPAAVVAIDPKYTVHREHIHKAVDCKFTLLLSHNYSFIHNNKPR
ncbi:hypothetical protein O3G_MSEX005489 [Manduca sexta]|uniref:AMP-dependent synthetase/ligase domain-containing protein n=1 Tax=Manduca sexta TaxID=7130 RepID=A0A921YYW6_MANSE|nr:hypothetical protein O3G_MSEX005489 [Manduca sexta]